MKQDVVFNFSELNVQELSHSELEQVEGGCLFALLFGFMLGAGIVSLLLSRGE